MGEEGGEGVGLPAMQEECVGVPGVGAVLCGRGDYSGSVARMAL